MPTILVVDDDEAVQNLVSDTLQYAGYDSILAPNGAAGVQLAGEYRPDLIISDVNMPYLDGFQMLEQIRRAPETSTIPVIFLTAEGSNDNLRRGMLGGGEDFLVKPISPRDLLSSVKVQLEKRSALEEKHHTTLRLLRKNIIYALPHELRTPLQLIAGYADLMEMEGGDTPPEDVVQYAHSISSASRRLERLIENYLIYAQLELIELDEEALAEARNNLVRDITPIIAAAANNRAAEYNRTADLHLDLCHVALRISEKDLSKIIFELVDNAFKFSEAGTPVLLQATRQDDLLRLLIVDNGRGMSAEELDLSGAYMQFGRELYEQQGLGLGLTLARRLTQLHNGAFNVESAAGEGTAVSVRFSVY